MPQVNVNTDHLKLDPYKIFKSFMRSLCLLTLFGLMSPGFAQTSPSNPLSGEVKWKPSEETLEKAVALYKQRCAQCHGNRGTGRGRLSYNLNPKPTNLRSNVWFRSTTPDKIKRVILSGGGAIGKSILMPANPDLRNKPKLVAALVYYITRLVDRTPPSSK